MGKINFINNSNVYCSVYGCYSKYGSEGVKSFHTFPKKGSGRVKIKNKLGSLDSIDRFEAWKKILKMGKKISETMRICSLHFSDCNYINKSKYKQKNMKPVEMNRLR